MYYHFVPGCKLKGSRNETPTVVYTDACIDLRTLETKNIELFSHACICAPVSFGDTKFLYSTEQILIRNFRPAVYIGFSGNLNFRVSRDIETQIDTRYGI